MLGSDPCLMCSCVMCICYIIRSRSMSDNWQYRIGAVRFINPIAWCVIMNLWPHYPTCAKSEAKRINEVPAFPALHMSFTFPPQKSTYVSSSNHDIPIQPQLLALLSIAHFFALFHLRCIFIVVILTSEAVDFENKFPSHYHPNPTPLNESVSWCS